MNLELSWEGKDGTETGELSSQIWHRAGKPITIYSIDRRIQPHIPPSHPFSPIQTCYLVLSISPFWTFGPPPPLNGLFQPPSLCCRFETCSLVEFNITMKRWRERACGAGASRACLNLKYERCVARRRNVGRCQPKTLSSEFGQSFINSIQLNQ